LFRIPFFPYTKRKVCSIIVVNFLTKVNYKYTLTKKIVGIVNNF